MAVSFKAGYKYNGTRRIEPVVIAETLGSNGITIRTATKWADGTTSCNCPGWGNRRTCKHSKEVETMTTSRIISSGNAGPSTLAYREAVSKSHGRGFEL